MNLKCAFPKKRIKNKVSLGHCWSLLTEAREGTSSMLDDVFLLLYSQRYVYTCFGCHVTNKKTINIVVLGD